MAVITPGVVYSEIDDLEHFIVQTNSSATSNVQYATFTFPKVYVFKGLYPEHSVHEILLKIIPKIESKYMELLKIEIDPRVYHRLVRESGDMTRYDYQIPSKEELGKVGVVGRFCGFQIVVNKNHPVNEIWFYTKNRNTGNIEDGPQEFVKMIRLATTSTTDEAYQEIKIPKKGRLIRLP